MMKRFYVFLATMAIMLAAFCVIPSQTADAASITGAQTISGAAKAVSATATYTPDQIYAGLDKLRIKFPDGKYWNHYGSSTINQDKWTETPCPSGHYLNGVQQCNGQCDGFARKLGLDLFGLSSYSWTKTTYDIDTICVGDIIRYGSRHTIMVTGFTEYDDYLIITDCNWDYHCGISWDRWFDTDRYFAGGVNFVLHYPGNYLNREAYKKYSPEDYYAANPNAGIYAIAYDGNGGSGSMNASYIPAGSTFTLASNAYTRAGYAFTGWNVYRYSDDKWYVSGHGWVDEDTIEANGYTKKLYSNKWSGGLNSSWTTGTSSGDAFIFVAQWKEKKYYIKYDANGGTGTMTDSSVLESKTFTLSKNTFEKDGCAFMGWKVQRKSDGKWYVSGQGWVDESTAKSKGYTIKIYNDKWSGGLNSSWTNGGVIGDTYTFYAQWSTKGYNVTYDANGGTGEMGSQYVAGGGYFTLSQNTFKSYDSDYIFAGWYVQRQSDGAWYTVGYGWKTDEQIDANGYQKKLYSDKWAGGLNASWTNGAPAVDEFVFFAQWKLNQYTIVYNANGGSGYMYDDTVRGGSYFELSKNVYDKDGSAFVGWYVQRKSDGAWYTAGYGWKTDAQIAANRYSKKVYSDCWSGGLNSSWTNGGVIGDTYTFYAQWSTNGYNIEYYSDDSYGTMASAYLTKDARFTLSENDFYRYGYYTFLGWYVQRESDSKWYTVGYGWRTDAEIAAKGYQKKLYSDKWSGALNDSWVSGASAGDTFTFHAQWQMDAYLIQYDGNGGYGISYSHYIWDNDTLYLYANEYSRSGYDFTGWYVQRSSDSKWYTVGYGWKTDAEIAA